MRPAASGATTSRARIIDLDVATGHSRSRRAFDEIVLGMLRESNSFAARPVNAPAQLDAVIGNVPCPFDHRDLPRVAVRNQRGESQ